MKETENPSGTEDLSTSSEVSYDSVNEELQEYGKTHDVIRILIYLCDDVVVSQ